MSTPALDRDRLLADLESAAAWAHVRPEGGRPVRWVKLRGYEMACRVILAAIEDGDYDVDQEGGEHR